MSDSKIHLSWIPRQRRIRCSLSKKECDAAEHPPADILLRAKSKLDAEVENGNISFYRFFETRLNNVWKKLREADVSPDTSVDLTLCSGSPELQGLSIEPCEKELGIALVTFDTTVETIKGWEPHFLKLSIGKLLRDNGITQIANPAHIKKLWLKACTGEKVQSYPLDAMLEILDEEDPYIIIEDQKRGDATVAILDINAFKNPDTMKSLKSDLALINNIKKHEDNREYYFLYDNLVRSIRAAETGPEQFGIDLPLVELVAIDSIKIGDDQDLIKHLELNSAARPKTVKKQAWNSDSVIKIELSDDKLKATIEGNNQNMYTAHTEFALFEMIKGEIKKQGIIHGVKEEFLEEIEDKIMCHESLVGCTVAVGDQMVPGADPYLHPTHLDVKQKRSKKGSDVIDIREQQGQNMVQKDHVVAEIIFDNPPLTGKDIFGGAIPAILEKLPEIEMGHGIRVNKQGTKFRAEFAGIPKVGETSIELDKAMIHDGNVNLASGNIQFQGPVEITGSIEQGAIVDVDGDLLIHKGIRGGRVQCTGTLTVKSGISTGPDGLVICGGDIETEFIENTEVHCKGAITVQKAILNSHIFTGKSLIVKDGNGMIIGGVIACFDKLECANIGRTEGAHTKLAIGTNWQAEIAVRMRYKRMAKLEALDDKLQKELTLLASKSSAQTTQQHAFQRSRIRKKLKILKRILKRKKGYIANAKSRRNYNKEAFVIVKQTLASNVSIKLAGNPVSNTRDVNSIAVYYRGNGVKIKTIERFKALQANVAN